MAHDMNRENNYQARGITLSEMGAGILWCLHFVASPTFAKNESTSRNPKSHVVAAFLLYILSTVTNPF